MKDTIRFIQLKTTVATKIDKQAFTFRKDKGYHWLQKLCLYGLEKLGAYREVDAIKYDVVEFSPKDFVDALLTMNYAVLGSLSPDRKLELIIGAEDFRELMSLPHVNQLMSFTAQVHYADRQGGRTIMGLPVTVVPWMSGMIVIPKRTIDDRR